MQAMELTMLGTGNAMVTKCYNTCFLLKCNGEYMLTDAGGGNGIMVQLEKARVSYQDIHTMFITHGHTDHVMGAVWVIRKIATLMEGGKYDGDFHIYCHDEVKHMLMTFCEMMLVAKLVKHIGKEIQIHVVEDGTEFKALGLSFTAFDIGSTKIKQFGYQMKMEDGRTLTCIGDEPYNERCSSYVTGTDWLLCEAFCLYEDRDVFKPYEKHHSTAMDAGKLANELGVKNLILYHTEDKNLAVRKERYTLEAKQNFDGAVFVPDDLDTIAIQ
ncbi:MAG: MBL fold metallo-hydrolase [Lachnospiraceae bacterium]|nr:MBL fold metallo-hydrolase [Lachnospiraceae bacterium]